MFKKEKEQLRTHLPSTILMTDGKSAGKLKQLQSHWNKLRASFDLPRFSASPLAMLMALS